jgi:hypothetical protein
MCIIEKGKDVQNSQWTMGKEKKEVIQAMRMKKKGKTTKRNMDITPTIFDCLLYLPVFILSICLYFINLCEVEKRT